MMTRRDLVVGTVGIAATRCAFALADQPAPVLPSAVFDWNAIPAEKTNVGAVRHFFKAPTATLDQLEVHVTTLNPGERPHPPHQHPNEEMLVLKEGSLEALVNGEWKKVGPGSVVFFASNQLHGVRNPGDAPATYHVINCSTPATPREKAAP